MLVLGPGGGQEIIIENGAENHGTDLRHILPTCLVINTTTVRSLYGWIGVVMSA